MDVEDSVVMRQLTAMALEKATLELAAKAEQFAATLPSDISGKDALTAFAAAIRSTNQKTWPAGKPE